MVLTPLCSFFFQKIRTSVIISASTWSTSSDESRFFLGEGEGWRQLPKVGVLTYFLAQNCMKMKEFGPPRAGARPWRPLRSATNIYFSVTKSGSVHLDE